MDYPTDIIEKSYTLSTGEIFMVDDAAQKAAVMQLLANNDSDDKQREQSSNLLDIASLKQIDVGEKLALVSSVSQGTTVVRVVLSGAEQGALAVEHLEGLTVFGDVETGILTLSGGAAAIQQALSNILYIPNDSKPSVGDIDVKLSFLSQSAEQLELLHSETISLNANSSNKVLDVVDKELVRSSGESQISYQSIQSSASDNPNPQTTFNTAQTASASIQSEAVNASTAPLTQLGVLKPATEKEIFSTNKAPSDITVTGTQSVGEQVLSIGDATGISIFDPSGEVIAELSTVDEDIADTHTYSITSDPTGWFEIINDNQIAVRAGAEVDYETATIANIVVRTQDDKGLGYNEAIAITIGDAEGAFIGAAGIDSIIGSSEEDIIDSGAGNDTVRSGAGADTITSSSGTNYIYGEEGSDSIEGGTGADLIYGGAGADTIDGNTGTDYARYSNSSSAVNVNLLTNTYSGGDAEGDVYISIERVEGSQGNDTLVADNSNYWLSGFSGNDSITGGTGNDTLYGDYHLVSNSSGGNDTIDGGIGNDNILGQGGDDSLIGGNGEDTINGGDGNDTIDGGSNNDLILGGDGNDVINGNQGQNIIDGGNGHDAINGGTGDDIINGGDGNDVIDGGNLSDSIIGGAGNDSLSGGAFEDLLNGGAGQDTLSGAPIAPDIFVFTSLADSTSTASDIITDYRINEDVIALDGLGITGVGVGATEVTITDDGSNTFITHNSSTFHITLNGVFSADDITILYTTPTFGNISSENITGTAGSDILFGNRGNDTLDGGDGDDFISGGFQNDSIDGGAGNDTIDGGTENDSIDGGDGDDAINGGVGDDTIDGGDGNDTIDAGDGANSIIGGAGNDSIISGIGLDTIDGGDGDDTIDGGDTKDVINGGSGNDSIDGGLHNDDINGGDDNDTLNGGTGNDSINGDAGNDSIDGGFHDDIINGGDGDDTLQGGAGADSIDGGAGENLVTYFSSTSAVVLNLLTNSNSGGDATGDILTNIQHLGGSDSNAGDSLTGGTLATVLYGYGGDDTLIGNNGDDTFDGGAGADSIDGGGGTNWISYSGTEGVTVNLSTNIHTGGEAEGDTLINIRNIEGTNIADNLTGDDFGNTIHGGDGNDTIEGGSGGDTIDGGADNDTLNGGVSQDSIYGGSGNDVIDGGDNEDILDGGAGQDTLIGGASFADVFTFSNLTDSTTTASDIITDYTVSEDVIHLDGLGIMGVGVGANQVSITDDGAQTFIDHNSSSFRITLDGVYTASDVIIIDDGDVLFEDSGSNTVTGSSENDAIFGNGGNDSLI